MLEILIAVTIISLSCMPIMYMASYTTETTRLDRVRFEVESICHNALERFGQVQDNLACLMTPDPANPKILVADNIHNHLASLYTNPGHLGMDYLVTQHKFRMRVELRLGVAPGLDQLTCRVSWISDRERRAKEETIAYARYILHEHYH